MADHACSIRSADTTEGDSAGAAGFGGRHGHTASEDACLSVEVQFHATYLRTGHGSHAGALDRERDFSVSRDIFTDEIKLCIDDAFFETQDV